MKWQEEEEYEDIKGEQKKVEELGYEVTKEEKQREEEEKEDKEVNKNGYE